MVRASQRTGLFDRLGAIQLPSEMLLRVAIRFKSAQRKVFPNGRDQEVAFEHGGISRGARHVHRLRWLPWRMTPSQVSLEYSRGWL